jgi:hypothetical protein
MHPGSAWGAPPPFGSPIASMAQQVRPQGSRTDVALRHSLCRACKELEASGVADAEGFAELSAVRQQESMVITDDISDARLLILCETEGNESNGGGTFDIRRNDLDPRKHSIRWVPDLIGPPLRRAVGAPGMIGSPIIGSGSAGPSRP